MNKIKIFMAQSWLLIVSAFIFGLLIALTNAALAPIIAQNEKDKLNDLMSSLVTEADSFELAVDDANIPASKGKILITDIYRGIDKAGQTTGFAFIAEGPGFADKIKLVIAIDSAAEKLLGYKVLSSNETPGFGDKIKEPFFATQFPASPAAILKLSKQGDAKMIDSQIIAITGATVSSDAVVKIFNTYIEPVKKQIKEKGL